MKKCFLSKIYFTFVIIISVSAFLPVQVWAQTAKLKISDFVLFGGSQNKAGGGVELNANANIKSGDVGSHYLVNSSNNAFFGGNIHSAGRIALKNNNTVKGNISASTILNLNGLILETGSGTTIWGSIHVNGSVEIKNGSVKGKVIHPEGTSYSGPAPAMGNITGVPSIPQMPDMPAISIFPAAGTALINTTRTITPSRYGKIALKGNQTITFSEPGIYVFSEIKNSGSTNNFVFDFKNQPSGVFRLYIHGDVDLNSVNTSMINGGSESRIYTEVHGNGLTSSSKSVAFGTANGSSGNNSSAWLGTVWAPYGSVNIGAGGQTNLRGAIYSGKKITLQTGVTINHVPLSECITPNVDAGPEKQLNCTITSIQLTGSSSTPNVEYSWRAINGGFISSGANSSSPTVTAGGDYILTVSTPSGDCSASDTVKVKFDACILPDYPPPLGGKISNIIGAELNSLYLHFGTGSPLSGNVFQIKSDSVYIEVIARAGQYNSLRALIQTSNYGMTELVDNGSGTLTITGKYPISNLKKLDDLPELIDFCRPLYPPLANSGIALTLGDKSIRADFVRGGYDLSGEGVKVGVLSDSYNSIPGNPAQTDVANGDLPGAGNPNNPNPVEVIKDYPFGRRSDEGRAMLQIVHDIAPKATLAFRTGFISPADFAQGIRELRQANCNIIVDDITFITEPFFQDGVVAAAVDEVTSQGVAYFSAAGNYGGKSYEGIFNPVTAPAGITGLAHNFGGGDILQNLSLTPGSYTIVLQWEDGVYSLGETPSGAANDLDIFLTDNNGSTLFGFNRNNIGADPIEILPFNVTLNTSTNILISRASGSGNVRFKYVIFRGDPVINEHNTGNSTIVGQANALGAIAVGAVLYTNTPAFGNVPSMASFSSIGGTRVNGSLRIKPDFAAPNGINTTVELGGENIDNDAFPNFFGTSAAAPHAAAAAALLIEAKRKYATEDLLPAELRDLMRSSALNVGSPGFDVFSGFGLIQTDAAIRTFASPRPELSELELPSTGFEPGPQPFTLIVRGNFLDPTSVVTFRGDPIPTTFINTNELSASIPAFIGNPGIQVFTQSISPSQIDGGYSDTLYFFSPVKKNIIIKAEDKAKSFGEKMPAFTVSILVDDVLLAESGLSLSDLGLENIQFTSPADNFSNTGNYFIRPFITPFDPADPNDIALQESYNYTFVDGILSIRKIPLVITPKKTSLTYGEKIGNFDYKFDYNESIIDPADRSAFASNLQAAYRENLAQAIALVDAKALVNGRALVNSDLESLSFLVSARALVNARQIINARAIVNTVTVYDTTRIVDVAVASVFNYQVDSAAAILVSAKPLINAKAIINAKTLINGTATVNSRQLINGSSIVNSSTVDDAAGQVVVIIDQDDVNAPAGDILNEFRSISMVTGITSGVFVIVPGALLSDNFEVSYGLGILSIKPAKLRVTAHDKVISKGSPLPAFTSTISGYQNGDVLPVSYGPKYLVSPECYGAPGVYTITPYKLTFSVPVPDYQVEYISGKLYINPKGSGAKKIKPTLDCIETLSNHPSGFNYVAHFSYLNNNSTPVYIPIGADNKIVTAGTYQGVQPIVFQPGKGTFDIYFNGSGLSWTVKSYELNSLSALSATASSSSPQCKTFDKLASAMQMSTEKPQGNSRLTHSGSIIDEILLEEDPGIYPNPVESLVTIRWKNISETDIHITDISGRTYRLDHIRKPSEDSLELDLSGLTTGLYLIKVKGESNYKILPVIKM